MHGLGQTSEIKEANDQVTMALSKPGDDSDTGVGNVTEVVEKRAVSRSAWTIVFSFIALTSGELKLCPSSALFSGLGILQPRD